MDKEQTLLEMKGITKVFPGVKALDNVDLEVKKGEVLALLGENGAGKSTLLKILSGAYQKDEGEIFIEGQRCMIGNPSDAYNLGIRIIYQELNYIPDLSVAENIFQGNLFYNKFHFVDWKKTNAEAGKLLEKVGLHIDVTRPIGELSVMEKQLIEVAKALSTEMKILIMDEPTSSLNEKEVTSLVKLVREIAAKGIGVIFISHRLEELYLVADRITIMRDGQYIGTEDMKSVSREQLIRMMVGREMKDMFVKEAAKPGEIVFEAKGITTKAVTDITLHVKSGEILGIYGLMGAGREEMAETFFGLHHITSGSLFMEGNQIKVDHPREAIARGIAYVPAERKSDSLILIQTVRENTTMASLDKITKKGIISRSEESRITKKWIEKFGIKTPTGETVIENLSGGNQQKVVMGRWMEMKPRLLILNDPTRGVDVGAKSEIYKIIDELCRAGTAIIMISSDMSELLSMSDRVAAMSEGRICGELSRQEVTQEKLMELVVGGK